MGCFSGVEKNWSSLTDVGRTHIATKGTVQSGLVLNLDAGVSSSYSGSGTTWSDLSVGTGALPIYNTTNAYGTVKDIGTRTDANANSLVLAIPMDGVNNGTTFIDESANIKGSGSAKTITRVGDTKTLTAVSKFYGSSGFFDGSGDYLSLGTSSDYLFGTGDFTIEGWFYLTSDSTRQDLMGNYTDATTGWGIMTGYGVTGQIGFYYGNNVILDSASRVWSPNSWTHFAITRSGTSLKLFVNGVNTTTTTNSTNISTTSYNTLLGAVTGVGGAPQLLCTGYLQDIRIYKGVAKYTSNFIPSGSPRNGTLNGGITFNSSNGGYLLFNGTNGFVSNTLPNLGISGNAAITLSCWFYTSASSFVTLLSYGGGGSSAGDTFALTVSANGAYDVSMQFNGATSVTSSSSIFLPNTWNNFTATKTPGAANTTTKLYLNGIALTIASASTITPNVLPSVLNVGRWVDATFGYFFPGRISNTQIYNRALTASEISQNFQALRNRYGI